MATIPIPQGATVGDPQSGGMPIPEGAQIGEPSEEKNNSVGGGLLRRGWDTVKSGLTSTLPHVSMDEVRELGTNPTFGNKMRMFAHATPGIAPISRMIEGQAGAEQEAAHQTADQWKRGEHLRAGVTALSMADPFATGSVTNVNRLEDEGRNKEAIGQGGFDALALATGTKPGRAVMDAVPVSRVARSAGVLAKPFGKMALEGAKSIPGVGGVIKGANAFREVPSGLRDAWAKPSPEVEAGESVAPAEPAPSPYRMRGSQIQDAATVTPRRIVQPRGLLTQGTPDVAAPPEVAPAPYRMRGDQIPDAKTATPRLVRPPSLQLGQGEVLPPAAKPVARAATAEQPAVWPPERPSVIQPKEFRGRADSLEDKGFQEANREDLEKHGHSAFSQAKRDWFARNVPGSSKGDLVAQARGEVPVESPNGSGESSASREAISRAASEKANKVERFRIDTRSGKETPLIGVDAVDAKAGPYDRIVKRGPSGEEIVDEGPKARPAKKTPQVATNDNLEQVLSRATKGLKARSAKAGDD